MCECQKNLINATEKLTEKVIPPLEAVNDRLGGLYHSKNQL